MHDALIYIPEQPAYLPSPATPSPPLHFALQKHFGVDLPHSVLAYMDPILVKKIDWETTNGLDDWDSVLEDTGSEYAKEQWGVEALPHHFLPLIRYRRAKERRTHGTFEAETTSVVRH